MTSLEYDIYTSPVGEIFLASEQEKLCFLDFNDNDGRIEKLLTQRFGEYKLTRKPGLLNMQQKLDSYFEGDWDAFKRFETGNFWYGFSAKSLAAASTDIPR